MLEIKIDIAPMTARVQNMLADVEGFYGDVIVDFVAWQEQDMKRKQAAIVPVPPTEVYTMIYPRSRLLKWKRRGRRRRTGRRLLLPRAAPGKSQRPILRPELFDRLQDRMGQLLIDKLKWR